MSSKALQMANRYPRATGIAAGAPSGASAAAMLFAQNAGSTEPLNSFSMNWRTSSEW